MRFMTAMKKPLLASVAAASLLTSGMVTAEVVDEKPSAGAMVVDAVFVRPLYFILSQAGSLVYGATLPFTLLGENATDAAETLVVTPLQGAFVRCLGCGDIDNEVAALEEGKGKTIRHFAMISAGQTNFDQDGNTGDGISGGAYLGTHFSLSDTSRFDVLLGYRSLGALDVEEGEANEYEAKTSSIQIASRFGKQIFWDIELMGKLGLHSWESDLKAKSDGSKLDFSGYDFFYGIALEKFITDDIRVGVEHTRYSLEEDDFEAKINTTDLNISYMF